MRILLSGSTGLIGSALMAHLRASHHEVIPLTRDPSIKNSVCWNPSTPSFQAKNFENFDVLIHLAGENIATKRWTRKRQEILMNSRCRDSHLLAQILSTLNNPPKVVISASAIGFYGSREKEVLTEKSSKGEGFLADLSEKWEDAIRPVEKKGIRVVFARFGVVLSPKGGMLKKILGPFKWGLGGKIGSGKQMISWVSLDDAVGAILHILNTPSLSGPVNIVSPHPMTQQAFATGLGVKLHRPTLLFLPKWLVRILFGQMGEELLLGSAYVVPEKLLASGYVYQSSHFEL